MKKILFMMLAVMLAGVTMLVAPPSVRADDKIKDEDRLKNAGQVA